eukprot:6188027-Pleurochrysis_carterae.AAC.4
MPRVTMLEGRLRHYDASRIWTRLARLLRVDVPRDCDRADHAASAVREDEPARAALRGSADRIAPRTATQIHVVVGYTSC